MRTERIRGKENTQNRAWHTGSVQQMLTPVTFVETEASQQTFKEYAPNRACCQGLELKRGPRP